MSDNNNSQNQTNDQAADQKPDQTPKPTSDQPTQTIKPTVPPHKLEKPDVGISWKKEKKTILFITHDLATARHFGDRVGVMYVGKLVEMGEVEDLFKNSFHPYTKALIDAIPTPVPGEKTYELPKGEVADSINPPSGCRFHPRCPYADPSICSKEEPELLEHHPDHWVACHFPLSSS